LLSNSISSLFSSILSFVSEFSISIG
jgi:hypothetical protein